MKFGGSVQSHAEAWHNLAGFAARSIPSTRSNFLPCMATWHDQLIQLVTSTNSHLSSRNARVQSESLPRRNVEGLEGGGGCLIEDDKKKRKSNGCGSTP